jgi:CheY-like chemotaxis protein
MLTSDCKQEGRMAISPIEADRDVPVRILLVDDNGANLLALEAVLEPLHQELVLARSGSEALEKLSEQECALVLDVHMPVLDGFQTVEAIRKRNGLRHLPVMFLTALFRDPHGQPDVHDLVSDRR